MTLKNVLGQAVWGNCVQTVSFQVPEKTVLAGSPAVTGTSCSSISERIPPNGWNTIAAVPGQHVHRNWTGLTTRRRDVVLLGLQGVTQEVHRQV